MFFDSENTKHCCQILLCLDERHLLTTALALAAAQYLFDCYC